MSEERHPDESLFYEKLRPYFPLAGSPEAIAHVLGLPSAAVPPIRGVYDRRVVPSWPFIEKLSLFVEVKRSGRLQRITRGIGGGAGKPVELERLHDGLLDALGIPFDHDLRRRDPEVMCFYNLYDNTIERFPISADRRVEAITAERAQARSIQAEITQTGADLTGTVGAETDRRVRAERGPRQRERARPVELWEDAPGYALKPNPMTAQNLQELLESLRRFWRWADKPGMRLLEERSGRVFSKSTVAKLIHGDSGSQTPPLSQKYVAGIIRGCGGDDDEVARWVTAFRLLDIAEQDAPRASVTMMRARKAQ